MDWTKLAQRALADGAIPHADALAVLNSSDDELLAVLNAAFEVRRKHFGRGVALHVIRNAKSGQCGEDCAFCSQSAAAETEIERYPLQTADEIAAGAREARRLGALRYCVVISGRNPAGDDLALICEAVGKIRREVPIQVCASLGLLDLEQARRLKAAGVDRCNHNLETAERFFPQICTTHTYADRLRTARAVKAAGMELCSGALLGMGESLEDRVETAIALHELGADSIPVNFLDPRRGTRLEDRVRLKPAACLRALAMFRFVNPDREIRVAGGREACLGPLQPLALFPANSIFTNGYLTTPGQGHPADLAMIEALGFQVAGITQA